MIWSGMDSDERSANCEPRPEAFRWRAVALFAVLCCLCGVLAIRVSLALHECAHVLVARAYGADVYAVFFPPVPRAFTAPETGLTLLRTYGADLSSDYVIVMAGLAAQVLAAVAALIAARRMRVGSITRVFLTLFGGINLLDTCLYVVSGFYSNRGDFAGVMTATAPFGRYGFALMFVTCVVAAYFVARAYLVLQDHWLGGGTFRTRLCLALLTAGPPFAALMTSQLLKHRWIGSVIVALYAVSGLIALRQTRGCNPLSPTAAFPRRSLAVLLAACVSVEGILIVHDGLIRMPDRVYAGSAKAEFSDRLIAPLPEGEYSMDIGEDGVLYYADAVEGTLNAYAPDTGQCTVLVAGLLHPQHVNVRNGAVYYIELGDPKHLSRVVRYDLSSQEQRVLLDKLYWPDCLYVAANGDVFFNEARRFFFVLRHNESRHQLLLNDFPDACTLVVDPNGEIHVATAPDTRKTRRSTLVVHRANGWERRMALPGTLFPKTMAVDAAGNLYIAGEGFCSITRVADGAPGSLRGSYCVEALCVTQDGDIYYISQEKPSPALRVLRRQQPR